MNNKKWFALIGLAAIAVLLFGLTGTGAWFTDTAQMQDIAVKSGNLDLSVTDAVRSAPILEPGGGYQQVLRYCLKNTGDYDIKYRGKLLIAADAKGMAEYAKFRLVLNPAGYQGNTGPRDEENKLVPTEWFKDISFGSLSQWNNHITVAPDVEPKLAFKPGEITCFALEAALSPDLTDAQKIGQLTINLNLDATQWKRTVGW